MNKFNLWCTAIILLTAPSAQAADRNETVIHDAHGNFNGQVITQRDGEQKFYDCHGQLIGWTTPSGTYNKHGNRVGSVLDLSKQMNDCRGKPVGR